MQSAFLRRAARDLVSLRSCFRRHRDHVGLFYSVSAAFRASFRIETVHPFPHGVACVFWLGLAPALFTRGENDLKAEIAKFVAFARVGLIMSSPLYRWALDQGAVTGCLASSVFRRPLRNKKSHARAEFHSQQVSAIPEDRVYKGLCQNTCAVSLPERTRLKSYWTKASPERSGNAHQQCDSSSSELKGVRLYRLIAPSIVVDEHLDGLVRKRLGTMNDT